LHNGHISLIVQIQPSKQTLISSFFESTNFTKDSIINTNGLNYILIKYNANYLKFLIDTGATISCIFSEYVHVRDIKNSPKITIKGVAGSTESAGSANILFTINSEQFRHDFCIVKKFDDSIQGVLGSDFFCKVAAIIDYEKFVISLHSQNTKITVPLHSSSEEYTVIPPRCEVIKYCYVSYENECIVVNEEVCEGVIVASIIVKPENNLIPVKILNVNEREIRLKNFRPKIDCCSAYNICHFGQN
jgi:hypothetical protein